MLCDRGLPRSLGGTWCHRAGVPVSCPAYGVPDQQGSTTASPRGGSGISPTESIRPRTARARRNGWTGCICQQQGSLSTAPRHSSDPLHHLRSAGPGFTPRFRIDHSHEQRRPVEEQRVQAHHDARALQVLRHGIRPSPTGSSSALRTRSPHPLDPGTAAPVRGLPLQRGDQHRVFPALLPFLDRLGERQLQLLALQRPARPRRRARQTPPQDRHLPPLRSPPLRGQLPHQFLDVGLHHQPEQVARVPPIARSLAPSRSHGPRDSAGRIPSSSRPVPSAHSLSRSACRPPPPPAASAACRSSHPRGSPATAGPASAGRKSTSAPSCRLKTGFRVVSISAPQLLSRSTWTSRLAWFPCH